MCSQCSKWHVHCWEEGFLDWRSEQCAPPPMEPIITFTTKPTLQVGEYRLFFDIERDGLPQVYLPKRHNRWLNISRYVVGTYQSGVQLHKITPGLGDYDDDKWRTGNKTKWTTKFPYSHNATKRKLYFNMYNRNCNLCFQPLFILYTLEKIGIFSKIFHLYKISSKTNKNNLSLIIINT